MEGFPFAHEETVPFTEARSVLVGYDYDAGQSAEVPERWRRGINDRAGAGIEAP